MGAGAGRKRYAAVNTRLASIDVVRDRAAEVTDAFVERAVHAALCEGDRPSRAVTILLTDDAGITDLHGQFMNDPTPTDVMSFEDDDTIDVAVNVDRAEQEAVARGTSMQSELALYVVHGVLHAVGFDDHDDVERRAMRDAERRVMNELGLRFDAVD